MSSPLKVSQIAGYLDQIQTGGGTEVDLTQFKLNQSMVVIFTDVQDYGIDSIQVNNKELAWNQYAELMAHDGEKIIVVFPQTFVYPEPVSITMKFEYDGDYTTRKVENLDLSSPKLICVSSSY